MQPTAQPDAATRSQFSARKVTLSLALFCFTSKHSKVTWSSSTHDVSSYEPLVIAARPQLLHVSLRYYCTIQHWLVFIIETGCVYCALRTESLDTIQASFRLHCVNRHSRSEITAHSSANVTFFIGQSILSCYIIWSGQNSPLGICALDRHTAWRHGYTQTTRYHHYLWWYFLVQRFKRQCDRR
jgi:hypothetical protein